jgi:hypothetical protein
MFLNQQSVEEMVKRPITLKKFVKEDILSLVEKAGEQFAPERLTTQEETVESCITIPKTFGSYDFVKEQLGEVMNAVSEHLYNEGCRWTGTTFCFSYSINMTEENEKEYKITLGFIYCLNQDINNPYEEAMEYLDDVFD